METRRENGFRFNPSDTFSSQHPWSSPARLAHPITRLRCPKRYCKLGPERGATERRHIVLTTERLPSVSLGFARVALRACLCTTILASVTFAIVSRGLFRAHAQRAAAERARLCAAALVPGPLGDIWSSVDDLRSRYNSLVAVAALDSLGNIQSVYPPDPAYRAAAWATLKEGSGVAATAVAIPGQPQMMWGVLVRLNGDSAPEARRAVLLLRDNSPKAGWATATELFALITIIGLFASFLVATRWLHRRVTMPLLRLGRAVSDRATTADRPITFDIGGWCETQKIADTLHELVRDLTLSDAKSKRIERQAEWQLSDFQRGFDRKLRRAEDRATTDSLTGLRNRGFLDAELEPLVTQQRSRGEDLAVVMIDADNFKDYNDTFGHKAGDDLLRFIGELLRASIRPTDYAIRYGGDEFLLMLPGAGTHHASQISERIVKLFSQYAARYEGSKSLSLSAGVASIKADMCETGVDLVTVADSALYHAKRSGKHAVACSAGL